VQAPAMRLSPADARKMLPALQRAATALGRIDAEPAKGAARRRVAPFAEPQADRPRAKRKETP